MSLLQVWGFIWDISGFKGRDGIPTMVKEYMAKKVMLDEFITHTMPLERINEAIQLMTEGKWWVIAAKSLLKIWYNF